MLASWRELLAKLGSGLALEFLRLAKSLVRAGCLPGGDDLISGTRDGVPVEADAVVGRFNL